MATFRDIPRPPLGVWMAAYGRFGWLPSRAKGRTRCQIAASACPTACSQMFDGLDNEQTRRRELGMRVKSLRAGAMIKG
jgi:hypothetical protein